jgi:hypothetical protein
MQHYTILAPSKPRLGQPKFLGAILAEEEAKAELLSQQPETTTSRPNPKRTCR